MNMGHWAGGGTAALQPQKFEPVHLRTHCINRDKALGNQHPDSLEMIAQSHSK